MTADLTPTEVAALRERAEALLPDEKGLYKGPDHPAAGGRVTVALNEEEWEWIRALDPATVLNLLDAAYDDTGQPWRDRAERAEEATEHFKAAAMLEGNRRIGLWARIEALVERAEQGEGVVIYPGHSTFYNVDTGLLRAALDEFDAAEDGAALRRDRDVALATIDRARTLAAEWQARAGDDPDPTTGLYGIYFDAAAAALRHVLDGDQEAT